MPKSFGPRIDRRQFLIASGATAALSVVTSPVSASKARVRALGLKVDYLDCPLGLENLQPRLSWRLESAERDVRQSAYQILVATSEARLREGRADLWNSGKIRSQRTIGIPYEGRTLASRQRCWWSVRVWDERDKPSATSPGSWWEMGLLDPTDWTAQWLAIESPAAAVDRRVGLNWIWGKQSREPSKRHFRLRFRISTASNGGEFFAVTNDWSLWSQITGVWIDGTAILGPTPYSDQWTRGVVTESDTTRLSLAPMGAGEHVLAVEVSTGALGPQWAETAYAHAVSWLARLDCANGETHRLGSGSDVKTSLVQDDRWFTPEYDDATWDRAQAAPVHHQPWPAAPAMHLRHEFLSTEPVLKARLYVTALGAYEARLNGRRVGDALLTPEISQYAKRVLYQVYDVTTMLRPGSNALALTVGDGWYASFDDRYAWDLPPRRVLAQLELTLNDGTRHMVTTGPGWRIAEAPIRESQIRIGEVYDARLEQPMWDASGFDDSEWLPGEVADTPKCRLVAQVSPAIRAKHVLQAQSIIESRPGVYVFDFGQHFAGWCRLNVKGPRGTRVELQFAEMLTSSGELHQSYLSMGQLKRDIYVLRGDESGETFEPHFTYRGFRYVQVSGLVSPPTAESVEGVFIHSDLPLTGRFQCDAELLTQIWRNTVQTQRSNFVGIQTDNPSREQRGHLMDVGIFLDTAAYNMDIASFASRLMDNVVDDQRPEGAFPGQAPEPYGGNAIYNQVGAPAAAHAGIAIPWILWRRYGDLAVIDRHWDAMNRHMQFILDHNPNHLWRNKRGPEPGWGDHADFSASEAIPPPASTPTDLIATAYWAYGAELLAQMARAVGRTTDVSRLQALHEQICLAFRQTFVRSDGVIGSDSQTGYILALQFGLLPETTRRAAVDRLAADIRSRDTALTTGILGTQFVLDVLAQAGHTSLVYDLLLRTDFPSWGHMIRNGATTIWEWWNGGNAAYFSARNQPALGSVGGFLFRGVAGIDAGAPGFQSVTIRPIVDPRVKRSGADYDSILGRISCHWEYKSDTVLLLDINIPTNVDARVHLPTGRTDHILESGRPIVGSKSTRMLDNRNQETVVSIGSGAYHFSVQPLPTTSS